MAVSCFKLNFVFFVGCILVARRVRVSELAGAATRIALWGIVANAWFFFLQPDALADLVGRLTTKHPGWQVNMIFEFAQLSWLFLGFVFFARGIGHAWSERTHTLLLVGGGASCGSPPQSRGACGVAKRRRWLVMHYISPRRPQEEDLF